MCGDGYQCCLRTLGRYLPPGAWDQGSRARGQGPGRLVRLGGRVGVGVRLSAFSQAGTRVAWRVVNDGASGAFAD